jgi:hypothetical protein
MEHAWTLGIIAQNWPSIRAVVLGLAILTLILAGAVIIHHQRLQRHKYAQQRGPLRHQTRTRRNRVAHFSKISSSIIEDASDLLFRESAMRYEARTLLPLVVEARQYGERLLRDRRRHHVWFWKAQEFRIEPLLAQLLLIEEQIRAVPRAAFTIEEVVAGRFECVRCEWT